MMLAAGVGFTFPSASTWLMSWLPAILFLLMLFTLLELDSTQLLQDFFTIDAWNYAFVHTVLLSILLCGLAFVLGAEPNLLLAISAITATGSAFAAPAIVKSIDLCPQPNRTMAMCIASTVLMPVVLYINLIIFQPDQFRLDLQAYLLRLMIFLLGPSVLAILMQKSIPQYRLKQISPINANIASFLVLCFPFGLIGSFAVVARQTPEYALKLQVIAVCITLCCFLVALFLFRTRGIKAAFCAAIASGNRNVLLTHAIAGSALGPEYLMLAGALQLPIFALPWLSKMLIGWAPNGR